MVCTNCSADIPEHAVKCLACGAAPTLVPRQKSPFEVSSHATVTPTATAAGRASTPNRIGRFEIESMLGKGGMGVVYRARDPELGIDVAIKALPAEALRDSKERERLKREIVTARAITHPNVIRIHEFGLGQDPFICMELLTGGSLADRLDRGRLAIPEAIHVCRQLADGLAAAHRQGVIHRDVKPLNVLFSEDGVPKLVDFGLARVADTTSSTLGFSGTPNYMSPEMADGRDLTVASDVYSFGVMLFECATGKLPFEGETLVRLVTLHTKEPPPKPSSIRLDVPKALEEVILRCLEKEPADRFQDAGEVAGALAALEKGEPLDIAPRRRVRRAPALIAGLALLALLGVSAGGWRMLHTAASPAPTAAAKTPVSTLAVAAASAAPTVVAMIPHPTPRAAPARTRVVAAPTPPTAGSVEITFRGHPWWDIVVDGKARGSTISDNGKVRDDGSISAGLKVSLAPGVHRVIATNPFADGGHRLTIPCTVTIPLPVGRPAIVEFDKDLRNCRVGVASD